jgi:hypothetical protein
MQTPGKDAYAQFPGIHKGSNPSSYHPVDEFLLLFNILDAYKVCTNHDLGLSVWEVLFQDMNLKEAAGLISSLAADLNYLSLDSGLLKLNNATEEMVLEYYLFDYEKKMNRYTPDHKQGYLDYDIWHKVSMHLGLDKTKEQLLQQGLCAFPSKGYSKHDIVFVQDFVQNPESGEQVWKFVTSRIQFDKMLIAKFSRKDIIDNPLFEIIL